MPSYPPLFPYVTRHFLAQNPLSRNPCLFFFNHGRSALAFLVRQLQAQERCFFLLPSYTCPTVLKSVLGQTEDYNFVDLDEDLDFELEDLQRVLAEVPAGCRVVLLPTHLFGIPTRDYKKLYPDFLVIEDRAQSVISPGSTADFQIGSFGRGKLIGAWNGGVILAKDPGITEAYRRVPAQRDFFKSYTLSFAQVLISKYLWSLLERTPLNPERRVGQEQQPSLPLRRAAGLKTRWMTNGLAAFDPGRRLAIGGAYRQGIRLELQYALGNKLPLLRYPIKIGQLNQKVLSRIGLSQLKSYRLTYEIARQRRGRTLEGACRLAYQSCFLPQHELLSDGYVQDTITQLNQHTAGSA